MSKHHPGKVDLDHLTRVLDEYLPFFDYLPFSPDISFSELFYSQKNTECFDVNYVVEDITFYTDRAERTEYRKIRGMKNLRTIPVAKALMYIASCYHYEMRPIQYSGADFQDITRQKNCREIDQWMRNFVRVLIHEEEQNYWAPTTTRIIFMTKFSEYCFLVSNETSEESFIQFHTDLQEHIYNNICYGSVPKREEFRNRCVQTFYVLCLITYLFKVENMFDNCKHIIMVYLTGNERFSMDWDWTIRKNGNYGPDVVQNLIIAKSIKKKKRKYQSSY